MAAVTATTTAAAAKAATVGSGVEKYAGGISGRETKNGRIETDHEGGGVVEKEGVKRRRFQQEEKERYLKHGSDCASVTLGGQNVDGANRPTSTRSADQVRNGGGVHGRWHRMYIYFMI